MAQEGPSSIAIFWLAWIPFEKACNHLCAEELVCVRQVPGFWCGLNSVHKQFTNNQRNKSQRARMRVSPATYSYLYEGNWSLPFIVMIHANPTLAGAFFPRAHSSRGYFPREASFTRFWSIHCCFGLFLCFGLRVVFTGFLRLSSSPAFSSLLIPEVIVLGNRRNKLLFVASSITPIGDVIL